MHVPRQVSTESEGVDAPKRRRQGRSERSLTASEAAALIGVSIATVRGWSDEGAIPSHRTVGGHRRFDPDELKTWLRDRGAPVGARARRRAGTGELAPMPELARLLNERIDVIVDRTSAGYHPDVPAPIAWRTPAGLQRATIRFVQAVSGALETGHPKNAAGRIELAGARGALEGDSGAAIVAEHTRIAAATLREAELIIEQNPTDDDALALATVHAVIDEAQAAVVRGAGFVLEQRSTD